MKSLKYVWIAIAVMVGVVVCVFVVPGLMTRSKNLATISKAIAEIEKIGVTHCQTDDTTFDIGHENNLHAYSDCSWADEALKTRRAVSLLQTSGWYLAKTSKIPSLGDWVDYKFTKVIDGTTFTLLLSDKDSGNSLKDSSNPLAVRVSI